MKLFGRRKSAEEKVVDASIALVTGIVRYHFDERYHPRNSKFGSPIERIFFAALVAKTKFGENDIGGLAEAQFRNVGRYDGNTVFFALQETIQGWKVDFALYVRDPFSDRESVVVVECDGHEFHERTKEQAARDRSRDRALTAAGIAIFRFTGSELWNDPMACAGQVVDHLGTVFFKYVDEQFEREKNNGQGVR